MIRAVFQNGAIIPSEAVDWPEGCEVLVDPVLPASERVGIDESAWSDDAASLADWGDWIQKLEPLEYGPAEQAEIERFEAAMRQFNTEAMRRPD